MACQSDPNVYAVVFRCPLEEGAELKTLADRAGKTISAYVAELVRGHLTHRELDSAEMSWVAEHLEANLARRAKADERTAAGYYKKKRRGRPRKPGPRKGKRKKVVSTTLSPDKGGSI